MSGTTAEVGEALKPRLVPLPPLPASAATDIGEAQWTTLMAIMDTVVPSLQMQQQLQLKSTPSKGGQVAQLDYNLAVEQLRKTAGGKDVDEILLKAYLKECPSEIAVFGEVLKRTLSCYVREKERSDLGSLLLLLKYVTTSSMPKPRLGISYALVRVVLMFRYFRKTMLTILSPLARGLDLSS